MLSSLNDAEISHLEHLISLRKQEILIECKSKGNSIVITSYPRKQIFEIVKAIQRAKGGVNNYCELEDIVISLKLVRLGEPQTFSGIDDIGIENLEYLGCELMTTQIAR